MNPPKPSTLDLAWRLHDRHWRNNTYCYPVVSRRSAGLSIGVNLNPDKACNFDCVYCQVDRREPSAVQKVNLDDLRAELTGLLDRVADGTLFAEPPFDVLKPEQRVIRDIAFSGDGEPTAYPRFPEAVRLVADLRRERGLADAKIVLITDACYLMRPAVREGLALMDVHNGEIWAKLDAGTEAYYQAVNRPNYPLTHVVENILDAARARPVVIQSLWMRLHGAPPPAAEVEAYCGRLNEILTGGGRIKLIQTYTIARETAEPYATMLTNAELDAVADLVRRRVSVPLTTYYGVRA